MTGVTPLERQRILDLNAVLEGLKDHVLDVINAFCADHGGSRIACRHPRVCVDEVNGDHVTVSHYCHGDDETEAYPLAALESEAAYLEWRADVAKQKRKAREAQQARERPQVEANERVVMERLMAKYGVHAAPPAD